jgi:hypothetical protein
MACKKSRKMTFHKTLTSVPVDDCYTSSIWKTCLTFCIAGLEFPLDRAFRGEHEWEYDFSLCP